MNEKQLREEWNKYSDMATDQDDGRLIGFTYIDVADWWLKKIKEARLSAIQEAIEALPKPLTEEYFGEINPATGDYIKGDWNISRLSVHDRITSFNACLGQTIMNLEKLKNNE